MGVVGDVTCRTLPVLYLAGGAHVGKWEHITVPHDMHHSLPRRVETSLIVTTCGHNRLKIRALFPRFADTPLQE